jgi:hypothetical protein
MTTDQTLEALAAKLNAMDLSPDEASALSAIMTRAAAVQPDDVEGFGWDEGVAAVKAGQPMGVMTHPYFATEGLKMSLGISAELGGGRVRPKP